ncbi:MAG: hypothetical protein MR761_01960 [Butyricicoccus porcorum]|nr:hypothetical protein [Butyricicoccus porcorum]MDD6987582.1 SpoIVB peptidase S55 domain-containing protein [Butyricicoccus porcorum]
MQDGKLVGAITYVLVNNPARGLTARLKNARSSRIREETERLAQWWAFLFACFLCL